MIAVDFLSRAFMQGAWKRSEGIARKILSPAEYAFWAQHAHPSRALFKFWLAKEATYKMLARQGVLARRFAPQDLACHFVSGDRFRSTSGSHRYAGRWRSDEKGLLALLQSAPHRSTHHFWVPYSAGARAPARRALWTAINTSRPAAPAMRRVDFADRHQTHFCRSYSAPWAVCSLEEA